MMKKAVFIDRDGVIIEDRSYAYKIEDLSFIPGAIDALKSLSGSDYLIIIVTNQAGIARGYFTEKDYHRFTAHLLALMREAGARIDAVYFCPHHPTEGRGEYKIDCECRKPKTGMLASAVKDLRVDLDSSWLVGDKSSDIKAGKSAGCRTILVRTGYAGAEGEEKAAPDYTVDDLKGAVRLILKEDAA